LARSFSSPFFLRVKMRRLFSANDCRVFFWLILGSDEGVPKHAHFSLMGVQPPLRAFLVTDFTNSNAIAESRIGRRLILINGFVFTDYYLT
jgi:hypothetical protein